MKILRNTILGAAEFYVFFDYSVAVLFAAISIIKTFEKAKICKQAVNIGLICFDHSKGQTKNKSKKFQKYFQKQIDLSISCQHWFDIL